MTGWGDLRNIKGDKKRGTAKYKRRADDTVEESKMGGKGDRDIKGEM